MEKAKYLCGKNKTLLKYDISGDVSIMCIKRNLEIMQAGGFWLNIIFIFCIVEWNVFRFLLCLDKNQSMSFQSIWMENGVTNWAI